MASSLPMKSINRQDLYTDLESRIQYLHSFLDFSSNDIEALISGAKYIKALVPAIVNIVYRKLLQYDITARAFTTNSTSSSPSPSSDETTTTTTDNASLSEDSPQILRRKLFLRAYLNKLCSDPSKMEFWEYLDKVGMMHVGLGRKHPLHVEYIHLGMCLGFIQDILSEAILSHPRLHMHRKIALVKALNKVIWIQNDLMAKWHVREASEFGLLTADLVIEKEGYLHGKRVLDDTEPQDAVAGDTVPAQAGKSECPFSSGLPILSRRHGTSSKSDQTKEEEGGVQKPAERESTGMACA